MRKYNKISEEKAVEEEQPKKKASTKKAASKKAEDIPEKKSEPEKDNKEVEDLAYKFIAGEFGCDTDTARQRLAAAGKDPSEVISVAVQILNGTYFK